MHGFLVLIFLLFLLDPIKSDDSSLNATFLAELVLVFFFDFFFLVRETHRTALIWPVFKLGANHLEKLIDVTVVAFKFLAVDGDTRMQMNAHLLLFHVVAIEERLRSRAIVLVILKRRQFIHLLEETLLVLFDIVFGVDLGDLDGFVEAGVGDELGLLRNSLVLLLNASFNEHVHESEPV